MAENNSVQQVKIVTNEINLRATSLRANLTNYIAILKCGTSAEIDEARHNFDRAVIEFKKAVVTN